jgi:peptide chain release factor 2
MFVTIKVHKKGVNMVEYDQLKFKLESLEKPLERIKESLDLDSKTKRIEELEADMESPGFWDNPEKSNMAMKELKTLKSSFERYDELQRKLEATKTLIDMAEEEDDASLVDEVTDEVNSLSDKMDELRVETLLSGEYDNCNAILTLHAGAGGTESCDWCQMLFRMYTRWAERHDCSYEVIDYLDGDEAGIKSVTIEIKGDNVYGHLKSEHGIHRLVRISPFNAAGKRQTSFVSCDVMPDIDTDIDIEINEDDLRIDTYRASGAGGQHINKTSSAIRITHLPTGIVVQCQNERSQHQNKEKAMQMLKAKLYLQAQEANAKNAAQIRGDVKDINFGSQIRSYILQPYTMVKDHRTGKDIGNAQMVLDGGIDPFINAYLIYLSTGAKAGDTE